MNFASQIFRYQTHIRRKEELYPKTKESELNGKGLTKEKRRRDGNGKWETRR